MVRAIPRGGHVRADETSGPGHVRRRRRTRSRLRRPNVTTVTSLLKGRNVVAGALFPRSAARQCSVEWRATCVVNGTS
jgi:hypothetical protein